MKAGDTSLPGGAHPCSCAATGEVFATSPLNSTVVGDEREWLFLQLTGASKFKFHNLISTQSIATLRKLTASIDIAMPEDISFAKMDVRVCKTRWLMKVCVLISLTLVNLQMFQYTIVSHTIITYYDTSMDLVNWTSLIYMLSYVIFTFPVSYLLDNRIVVSGMSTFDDQFNS